MSVAAWLFKTMCEKGDAKRDEHLVEPGDVIAWKDINYAENEDPYNTLDVYCKKGTKSPLPVIVSIHGGGYVYGTKEIYKHYGMFLAQEGFVFVNFNYHLAPEMKFPGQLMEINQVLTWMCKHHEAYFMDLDRVFFVGDSAGAQMTSQMATIYSNPEYAKLFPFEIPKQIHLRGIGLNCGMYDFARTAARKDGGLMNGLIKDYLGNDVKNYNTKYGEMLKVLDYINENYPPAYIMTAYHDFLKEHAQPMCQFLTEKGVKSAWKCYGTKEQAYMSHVCHVNMNLAEAKEMNQDECEFFRGLM